MTLVSVQAGQTDEKTVFRVSSDGKSGIRLFWFEPFDTWPAGGWRITDDKGKIWADKITPLNPDVMKHLSKQQAESIEKMVEGIKSAPDRKIGDGWFIGRFPGKPRTASIHYSGICRRWQKRKTRGPRGENRHIRLWGNFA